MGILDRTGRKAFLHPMAVRDAAVHGRAVRDRAVLKVAGFCGN